MRVLIKESTRQAIGILGINGPLTKAKENKNNKIFKVATIADPICLKIHLQYLIANQIGKRRIYQNYED